MFASIGPQTIAVMIPIVAILGTFAIVIVAIVVEGRKKDLAHKERLFALEKGLPLPELPEKKERPVYATRRAWGLVWLGLGLALTIALALLIVFIAVWGFRMLRQYRAGGDPILLLALSIFAGYWSSGLFNFSFWSAWWQLAFILSMALALSIGSAHRREK